MECKHFWKTYIGSTVGFGVKLYECDDCHAVIADREIADKLRGAKKL